MKKPSDIWEDIGSLAKEDVFQLITTLFRVYEKQLEVSPDNREAINFFKNLDNVISQVNQCNLNRR